MFISISLNFTLKGVGDYTRNVENGRIEIKDGRIKLVPRILSPLEGETILNFWTYNNSDVEILPYGVRYEPRDVRFVCGLLGRREFSFYVPRVPVDGELSTLKITLKPSRASIIGDFLEDFKSCSKRHIEGDSLKTGYKTEESLGMANLSSGKLLQAVDCFKSALSKLRDIEKLFSPEKWDKDHEETVKRLKREISLAEREISRQSGFRPPTPPIRRGKLDLGCESSRMKRPLPMSFKGSALESARSKKSVPDNFKNEVLGDRTIRLPSVDE